MKTKDFSFELPKELIAQYPEERGASALLVYSRKSGSIVHSAVSNISEFLSPNTLVVVNNTAVRKARVPAQSDGGKTVEFLFLRPLADVSGEGGGGAGGGADTGEGEGATANREAEARAGANTPATENARPNTHTGTTENRGAEARASATANLRPLHHSSESMLWRVLLQNSKRFGSETGFTLAGGIRGELLASNTGDGLGVLCTEKNIGMEYFHKWGRVPLPPYIRRADEPNDQRSYQTIFAREHGSVAAPTAGLHISPQIMQSLKERGIRTCEITLHVGLGTFRPVRSENIEDHSMHSEDYAISPQSAQVISAHKRSGKPILAVGTTSLRCLEAAWQSESQTLRAGASSTDLFIYEGYQFKVVDALFTNFHTPKSTLLMLVSAFVGRERLLDIYQQAIDRRYRFFSYGDACLFL